MIHCPGCDTIPWADDSPCPGLPQPAPAEVWEHSTSCRGVDCYDSGCRIVAQRLVEAVKSAPEPVADVAGWLRWRAENLSAPYERGVLLNAADAWEMQYGNKK